MKHIKLDVTLYTNLCYVSGFALGSVEGRVAIQDVTPQNPKDNFTFKCHRSNGTPSGYQDIFAVSAMPWSLHGSTLSVSQFVFVAV